MSLRAWFHVSHLSVASHVASIFGNELAEDTEIHTLHYSDKQLTCSSSISVFSVNSFTGASIIPPVNESTEDMEAPGGYGGGYGGARERVNGAEY